MFGIIKRGIKNRSLEKSGAKRHSLAALFEADDVSGDEYLNTFRLLFQAGNGTRDFETEANLALDFVTSHVMKRVEVLFSEGKQATRQDIEVRAQLAVEQALASAVERIDRMLSEEQNLTKQDIEVRVQLGVEQAIAYASSELELQAARVDAFTRHLPALLNGLATVPALARKLAGSEATLKAQGETLEKQTAKWDDSGLQSRQMTLERGLAKNVTELQRMASALEFQGRTLEERAALWNSSDLHERQAALERGLAENDAALKILADALSSGSNDRGDLWKATAQVNRGVGDLWQRLEFIRKEILYEMRYGLNRDAPEPFPLRSASTRVVNEAALRPPSGEIRLNLGCGHIHLEGYVNVDARDLIGVDIVAEVGDLPFEKSSITEVFSAHVLEHFTEERLRRLLPYWRGLLKDGGCFKAVVPDGEAMLAALAAGTSSFEEFRMVLFGAQDYGGDFHYNLFTPESLSRMLVDAGFRDVAITVKGRKNDICFEFEIVALA